MTAEHEALLQIFLAEEAARGRRPRGLIELRRLTIAFLRFVEQGDRPVVALRDSDARAYQGSLVGRFERGEIMSATIIPYVAAASSLCAYLVRSGSLMHNPFELLRRVRSEQRVRTDILKEGDMAALLAELRVWDREGNRHFIQARYLAHVVAELQYASGLRIAEAAGLRPEDIDLDRALVYVREGKQGFSRTAFLTDYACRVLEEYLASMRRECGNMQNDRNAETVFLRGFPQLRATVNAQLEHACARLKLPVITSHGFRHALGYHLLRAGCPLRYIQAILGHRKIKNTEVYTKVDADDVKRVFDECHPRNYLQTRVSLRTQVSLRSDAGRAV